MHAHASPAQLLTDSYSEDEFLSDLIRVSGHETDEVLARLVVRKSAGCPEWMRRFGVRFQSPLRGTLHLARTNAFFLGGGKALMNSYYAAAERLGIRVVYDAEVVGLEMRDGQFRAATVRSGGRDRTIRARAAVMATGGFESNIDWLREIWGDAAANFIIRGTPYNKGTLLRLMLDAGAQPVGDPRECHAVAVDARAPKFDGGIVTRLDCLSLGIVVNQHAERFYDEGEDFWPKRYAIWGTLVARQPGQIAFSIVDAKAAGRFMPSVFPPKAASSIRELATQLNLPPEKLDATVETYNRAVRPGSFDHAVLDNCRTVGLNPEKTHWAQAHRHAAVLGISASSRHHVHLSWIEGERARAGADDRRRTRPQHLRGGRDHGREHPAEGVHRRRWHDHRYRVRPHRRRGGCAACRTLTRSRTART